MTEVGSWKDWLLWPLRSHFGSAPEPWQARPPPQVEPQFRREATRQDGAARPTEFRRRQQPVASDDPAGPHDFYDPGVVFKGLYKDGSELEAVFQIEDPRHPAGHLFRTRSRETLEKHGEVIPFLINDENDDPWFRTNLAEIRKAISAFERLEPQRGEARKAQVFEMPEPTEA